MTLLSKTPAQAQEVERPFTKILSFAGFLAKEIVAQPDHLLEQSIFLGRQVKVDGQIYIGIRPCLSRSLGPEEGGQEDVRFLLQRLAEPVENIAVQLFHVWPPPSRPSGAVSIMKYWQAFQRRFLDVVARPVRIFVYGTLMRGFELHRACFGDAPLTIDLGVTRGRLIHLPEGYPALLEGEGPVYGELITLAPHCAKQLWPTLDEAEGFIRSGHPSNLYERVKRAVVRRDGTKTQAWTYLYNDPKDALSRGVIVRGGDWRRFIRG